MESDLGKLFVGGISWDTDEDRLREYFGKYGEVVEAVIMKDRSTGRARGFGFVVFADPAAAERVIMDKHVIDGRTVEAKKAVPRDDQRALIRNNSSVHGSPGTSRTKKIFVGGLPSTLTESEFKKYFDQFGTITDVVVMYDHYTQRPRGFGFITYDSEDAVDKVLLRSFHELNGKMVEVKRAVPKELSPGPYIRSPVSGYTYGMNRPNSFPNGFFQGYNSSLIGGYGMRTDGILAPQTGGRSGLHSFGSGFGMGMNFESSLSPSYGGNSNYISTLGYGRALSPYYSGNSSRNSSSIGYGGDNENTSSFFSSMAHNVWGNGNLNYSTTSASSDNYMASGNGSIGSFGNISLSWGSSSSPISALVGESGSGYVSRTLGHGDSENSFGLGGRNFGRSSVGAPDNSLVTSSGGYEGTYPNRYGGSSFYGDPTWQSSFSELKGSSSFSYDIGNIVSDNAGKGSAGYMGSYNL